MNNFAEILEQRYKEFCDSLRAMQSAIGKHVCPIYNIEDQGIPRVIGSGVLLQVNDHRILITADHVLNEATPELCLFASDYSVQPLEFRPIIRSADYDFACLELEENSWKRLGHFSFLSPDDLELERSESEGIYIVYGYPRSRNKSRRDVGKIKNKPFSFAGRPVNISIYEMLGKDPEFTILFEYDRKNVVADNHRIEMSADPHCISGGGVWHVANWLSRQPYEGKLSGICVQYEQNPGKKTLEAVRFSRIWEDLRSALFVAAQPSPELKQNNDQ